jgi:hypothetical protein
MSSNKRRYQYAAVVVDDDDDAAGAGDRARCNQEAKRVCIDLTCSDDDADAPSQFDRLRPASAGVRGRLVAAERSASGRVQTASSLTGIDVQFEVAPDAESHRDAIDVVLRAVVPGYKEEQEKEMQAAQRPLSVVERAIRETLADLDNMDDMDESDNDEGGFDTDDDDDGDGDGWDDDDEDTSLSGFVVRDRKSKRISALEADDDSDGGVPVLDDAGCFNLVATYMMCCALDPSYKKSLMSSAAGAAMHGHQARSIWELPARVAESSVLTAAWRPGVRELLLRHCIVRTREPRGRELHEQCSVCRTAGHAPRHVVELFGVCPSSRGAASPEYDGTHIYADVQSLARLDNGADGDDLPIDRQHSAKLICGSTCYRRVMAYCSQVHFWKRAAYLCHVLLGHEGLRWQDVSRRALNGDPHEDDVAAYVSRCRLMYRRANKRAEEFLTQKVPGDADDDYY